MATTSIWEINKTLNRSIDYICNYEKTEGGLWITTNCASYQTAAAEMQVTKQMAKQVVGNYKNGRGNTLAYHFYQSFDEGEVTVEEAHEIGKQLCEEFLKQGYEFVLTTHVDTNHIHNHVIFNSTSKETYRKFHSKSLSRNATHKVLETLSDKICYEHQLSVITEKKSKKKWYKEYAEEHDIPSKESYRTILRENIDKAIELSSSYSSFLILMQTAGYQMKTKNSKGEYLKYLSFKGQGQQRYLRDRSLGEGYSKDEIMTRILEKDKGVYKISINEVLFKQKNENGHWEINKVDGKIRTRIPRNIKSTSGLLYWDIDENQCKKYEMLNQNKTLSIHFDDSMKINVYDAVGKLVTIMSAEELFSYYDDQSKSDLIQGQKLSEISTTSLSRAYPWGIRLQRIMQQEHSYNTKALVKAINTLSYEGVETRSDLRNKIADLQCQADEIPTKLEPIHTVTKDMQYILKNLRVYQENEKVYSGYLAKHKKEAFYDTFKNEIDSFLIAEKVLDERNIEPTSNVSEIEQRIEQAEQERIQIESELIELRDRLHALQYTNEVIEDVLESRETTYEIIQEKYQEK